VKISLYLDLSFKFDQVCLVVGLLNWDFLNFFSVFLIIIISLSIDVVNVNLDIVDLGLELINDGKFLSIELILDDCQFFVTL